MLSFKRLIEDKYKSSLEAEVKIFCEQDSKLFLKAHYPHQNYDEVQFNGFDIVRIGINDLPSNEIEVDIQIKMDLWVAKEDDEEWTPKTPWANLQGRFYIDENGYDLGSLVYRTYQDLVPIRPLNDQLVPIIGKNDFDKVAKEMLEQFYPEIFEYGQPVNPHLFAERMGLKIEYHNISPDIKERGLVFFKDGYLKIYNDESAKWEEVWVEKGIIVIQSSLKDMYGEGAYNNTIIHECVHWYLHYKAAMFGQIIHSEYQVSDGVIEKVSGQSDRKENQARWIAPCILMPKELCLNVIRQTQDEYRQIKHILEIITNQKSDELREMEWIVDSVKEKFNTSISSTKYRLKYLGYEEAMGVKNYINGAYVSSFGFSPGSLSNNQTFIIHYENFLELLESSNTFQQHLTELNYVYFNSLVIKNDEKYLTIDLDGSVTLTEYALKHMDECCMIFNISLKDREVQSLDFTALYHLADNPLKFSLSEDESIGDGLLKEAHNDIYLVLKELPNYFPDAISYIIDYFDYTLEKVSERCDLSVEKIRDMRKDEDVNHSKEAVMQFIIGMELPAHIGFKLLDISGHRLKTTIRDVEYTTLLISHGNRGLHEANKYLISRDLSPLGKTDKKYFSEKVL